MTQNNSMTSQIGKFYVVATPIGNIDDISFRAINTLKAVDLICAEDTRHSSRLMQHYAINTPMMSLHEHNEIARIQQITEKLNNGNNIALISDAGTPLISDPGFKLVRELRMLGFEISPVPGPSAIIAALSVAGLATDSFSFWGFLPAKSNARQQKYQQLSSHSETLVFYESSHRIFESLKDLQAVMGERSIVIGRELTKTFETILSGDVSTIIHILEQDPDQHKGEFVVMVQGAEVNQEELDASSKDLMKALLEELPPNKAAKIAASVTGIKKKLFYQWALEHKES